MRVYVQSVYQCLPIHLWGKVKKIAMLNKVVSPFLKFEPVYDSNMSFEWTAGEEYKFRLIFFGLFTGGEHEIKIVMVDDEEYEIRTQEHSRFIPKWNHVIKIRAKNSKCCLYVDEVDFEVKWGTLFLSLFVKIFYQYRHYRLRKLLTKTI